MPIYTCITYQACCDGCYKEYGMFPSVDEAQQAVKSDKDWKVIDGKAYCPECIANPPIPQENYEKAMDIIQQHLKHQEENGNKS